MKKLSMKGFADFMTASPSRQRTILRHYKYPAEDEPRARILYYRDARDRVAAYHTGNHEPKWLISEATSLRGLAQVSTGHTKTRLNHNARALRAYATNFADRNFEILDELLIPLQFDDVVITVRPDLHVTERNSEKIVKLEFGVNPPSNDMVRIISQLMFEASEQAGMGLTASMVLFLDVPRGDEQRGARMGARMRSDIEATCQIIDGIWPSI
jgi:hypothetical protein